MGQKKKFYDTKFFELCENLGRFDLENKTLFLKDNIKESNPDLSKLKKEYTFFITESIFNDSNR